MRQKSSEGMVQLDDSLLNEDPEDDLHIPEDDDFDEDEDDVQVIEKVEQPSSSRTTIQINIQFSEKKKHSIRVFNDEPFSKIIPKLKSSLKVNFLVLKFDGDNVDNSETPASLDMEDGDILDAS